MTITDLHHPAAPDPVHRPAVRARVHRPPRQPAAAHPRPRLAGVDRHGARQLASRAARDRHARSSRPLRWCPPSTARSTPPSTPTTCPARCSASEGDGPVTDVDANRVFDGFGATWDLYFEVYGRNSYDGHGAPLIGSVHYLNGYDNAFWSDDDGQMAFGDGDGQLFNSFTVSVDVMGHELTHAVTSRTSGLVYQDQSGALNEHVSDVFGSLVKQRVQQPPQTADQADWLIGQGLLAAGVNGVALRSMKAPGTAYDDPVLGQGPAAGHHGRLRRTRRTTTAACTPTPASRTRRSTSSPPRSAASPGSSAGMVWFATCTDGTLPSDASFQTFADHTTDHAYELFGHDVAQACATAWAGVGITVTTVRHVDHTQGRTQAPPIAGNPSGYTFVAPGSGEEDPCVVYRGVDSHVYGAWRSPRALGLDDLTTLAGAPLAMYDPVGYVFDQVGMQNASYVGVDSHLHGLYWNFGAVGHDDLSNLSGVFPTGTPAAYISPPYGMQNLVVRRGRRSQDAVVEHRAGRCRRHHRARRSPLAGRGRRGVLLLERRHRQRRLPDHRRAPAPALVGPGPGRARRPHRGGRRRSPGRGQAGGVLPGHRRDPPRDLPGPGRPPLRDVVAGPVGPGRGRPDRCRRAVRRSPATTRTPTSRPRRHPPRHLPQQ